MFGRSPTFQARFKTGGGRQGFWFSKGLTASRPGGPRRMSSFLQESQVRTLAEAWKLSWAFEARVLSHPGCGLRTMLGILHSPCAYVFSCPSFACPGNKKFTDKMTFTFSQEGSQCAVNACSESQSFSIGDFSTNYCNLRSPAQNLARFSKAESVGQPAALDPFVQAKS